MSDADLDRIEAAARGALARIEERTKLSASESHWREAGDVVAVRIQDEDYFIVRYLNDFGTEGILAHIATSDPLTVLALVGEIRRLRGNNV